MAYLKFLKGRWDKVCGIQKDELPQAIISGIDTYVAHDFTPILIKKTEKHWEVTVERITYQEATEGIKTWVHWTRLLLDDRGIIQKAIPGKYDYRIEPYPNTEPQPTDVDPDELARYRKRKATASANAEKAKAFEKGDRVANGKGREGTVEEIKDDKVIVRWDDDGRRRQVAPKSLMKV